MAAHLVLVINDPGTIATLKDKVRTEGGDDGQALLNSLTNYLMGLASGTTLDTDFYVVYRSTDPAVTTVGTGSVKDTYDLS